MIVLGRMQVYALRRGQYSSRTVVVVIGATKAEI